MKNSFFLVIPAQEARLDKLKEFEPKALEQWLFELPTANPGLATRLLQDFILGFNAVKMPLQDRLEALELMRPKVLIIEDYLRSRLIKAGFPKEENDTKILQVLTDIERCFTIGYWIVLKELTRRQISWFQGKSLVLSLQRCIKGLSSIVVSHSIMGLPVPDWVWIDLHSLFKLSIVLKKDNVKVSDATYRINKGCTPEECYRQVVLLSLCRPSGLMQKEILQTYDFIESVFPFFNFSKEAIEGQQYQFAILTDEDKPPFVQIEMHTARDSATLYLDLSRLYKALDKKDKFVNLAQTRFASIHLKNAEEKPTLELLEYLEQRWLGLEIQREALFGDRLDRYMAIGIAPAHSLQSAGSQDKAMGDGNGDGEQEILVQSESDRLLFCVFSQAGILSVGNLISFRRADQPVTKRTLAVVNELIVAKQSNRISFGVNLVAPSYQAVYYVLTGTAEKEAPLKGLFFSLDEQIGEASFIIVDNFILKEDDTIKMQLGQEMIVLALRGKKNVGLGYWQFECFRRTTASKIQQSQAQKGYDFI